MEAGTIGVWNVKEGDSFSAGDVIAEIETDKASMGFEAQDPGVVAKILVQAGTEVAVGAPVVIIVDDADDASELVATFAGYTVDAAPPAAAAAAAAEPPAVAAPAPPAAAAPAAPAAPAAGDRVFASPLARKLARDSGVDISAIAATGPRDRVVAADVEAHTPLAQPAATASAAPAAAATVAATFDTPAAISHGDGFTDFPVSQASAEIARRMTKAKQEVPHYYLTVDVEVTSLLATRELLNQGLAEGEAVSANDMLLKAAALAMKAVPDVNASWMDTFVRTYSRCDMNVAVGVGDGLVAPVVLDAGSKGIKAISDEVRAAALGAGALPSAYASGTFTVVNLGMFGVKSAAPIVAHPQAAVLGLGAISERVLPSEDPQEGEPIYRIASVLTATCSFDHRVVDGAVGAQWLAAFKNLVESPMTMLL